MGRGRPKINDGLTNAQRWQRKNLDYFVKWRANNLEKSRAVGRKSQAKLNNKVRFGGLRLKVLERDNYLCQHCRKDISAKNMAVVHHINEIKSDNTMKNLMSLCKSCHNKHHYHLQEFQFTPK